MWIVVVLVLISTATLCRGEDLKPRCGDCWCIWYGDDGLDSCPNSTGISDTFPANFAVYDTFELKNPDASYLQLRTPDGQECYPFANTLGEVDGYARSTLPQCAIPGYTVKGNETTALASMTEAVCAYKFQQDVECKGRQYEILTYNSTQEAEDDGAVVTHTGACGVCSNAKDLWARMRTIDDFETETLICATLYLVQPDSSEEKFDSLVQCAIKAGLSSECALLFAHLGAATVATCRDACQSNTDTGSTTTNGPPPTCALTPCLECPSSWNMYFNDMAGRSMERSGITENTAKPCSVFSRIEHDPCIGASDTVDQLKLNDTSSNTTAETNKSGSSTSRTMNGPFTSGMTLSIGVAVGLQLLLLRRTI